MSERGRNWVDERVGNYNKSSTYWVYDKRITVPDVPNMDHLPIIM